MYLHYIPHYTIGGFVRITDAVKGAFHPNPPPLPTYLEPPTKAQYGQFPAQVWAPMGDTDQGLEKAPEDPY